MTSPRDPVGEVIQRDASRLLGAASPRRMELVSMSVVRDAGTYALGALPGIGDFLADAWADNVWAEMRRQLTDQETATFTQVTRRFPDTLALVQTFRQVPEQG